LVTDVDQPEPRLLGFPLLIAIWVLPIVFAWLTLRRGYAGSTRLAVFTYMLAPSACMLAADLIVWIKGL
jgi:hypothetical protein